MNTSTNDLTDASQINSTKEVASLQQKEDVKSAITLANDERTQHQRRKHALAAITLQILIALSMLLLSMYYNRLHNIGWPFASAEEIASYNFVGVELGNLQPSPAAILIEVIVWSLLGVMARSEYNITHTLVQGEEFKVLESISRLIGDHAMGMAVAVAVVALFRSAELNIAQVNLTLKTANIESIIAISFILGFYHEDTRRLLGSFQKGIAGDIDEAKGKKPE